MNKIIKLSINIFLAFLIMGISSCQDDFLEVTPKRRLIAKTTADYNTLFNSITNHTAYSDAPFILGDDIVAIKSYYEAETLRSKNLFNWEDDVYLADENSTEFNTPLNDLYVYNKIINEVMDSEGGTAEEKLKIQAEARANRSWCLFYLVNLYGKPYNSATANTDIGFPIITEADLTETNFTRATVQEVYDFIIAELTEAIPNIPDFVHRFRMSKAAAQFFLAEAYINMGDFSKALTLLNNAENGLGGNADQPLFMNNLNTAFDAGGTLYPVGFFGPKYPLAPYRTDVFFVKYLMNYYTFFRNSYVASPDLMALYGENDMRLRLFSPIPYPSGAPFVAGLQRMKGNYSQHIGGTLPNFYLFKAECQARTGDLAGAVNTLEFFRNHRMPEEDAVIDASIAGNQNDLIHFIIEERRREFAMQAIRWFDMRRLSNDPLFAGTTYTRKVYDTDGTPTTTVTLRPERLTLRLPLKVMAQNPTMIQND